MTDALESTEFNDELNDVLSDEFEYPNPADDANELPGVTTKRDDQNKDNEEFDDRENYGKRVEKRINKMHAKHQIELEAFNTRIHNLEAELATERAAKRQEAQQQLTQDLAVKKQELTAKKIEALDRADHEEVVRLDEQLFDLAIQTTKPATQAPKQTDNRQDDQRAAPVQQQTTVDTRPKALLDWEAANQWVYDPRFADKKDKTNAILNALYAQGYTADDSDTWEELNRRLTRVVPPAPAPVDRGNVVDTGNQDVGQGRLTKVDIQTMIGLGLDPDDVNHRVRFAKNRSKS